MQHQDRSDRGSPEESSLHRPEDSSDLANLSDQEWRDRLSPQAYAVLRESGTEAPGTGEYVDDQTEGVYQCGACEAELFRSTEKFDSHCGWPSFFSPLAGEAIVEITDRSAGMTRTEVRCANCSSHLGHVFKGEGYDTPTDLRYCINSVALSRS
jgi:peptide-methionine (R)-S-oxide reductase